MEYKSEDILNGLGLLMEALNSDFVIQDKTVACLASEVFSHDRLGTL